MSRRFLTGLALIGCSGAALGAVSAGGVAAKPATQRTKVSCTAQAYNVSAPSLSGLALAVVDCSKPFGAGVQKATNTTSVVGSTLNVTGTFKNFFDNGTNHGTIKLTGKLTSGTITASGPLTITGGTGRYNHIKGKGKATCTTSDAGKTFYCTVSGTATL
jgi:hypothetical protein